MLCANFGFGALGGAAMNIVGISAFYHDSAAALVRDGEIIAAAQEERFSRKSVTTPGSPRTRSNIACPQAASRVKDVDYFVFYDKPFLKFERLLETYLAYAPRGFRSFAKAMPVWSGEKLFQREILRHALSRNMPAVDIEQKLIFTEHHQSHAASAFYPSPFERAAVLTMDGVGEWTTTSVGSGEGKSLDIHREIHFPHSLGLLYSAFTYYLGFKVNSGEYKVMGLAPYGEPKYAQLMRDHLIDIRDDGSFHLDLSYFDYCTGLRMTNEKFDALMGGPPRAAGRVADAAPHGHRGLDPGGDRGGSDAAGGARGRRAPACAIFVSPAASRSIAWRTAKLLRSGTVDRLWIQPAAGDAGGALGAALAAYHLYLDQPRRACNGSDGMLGAFLGPEFSQAEIEARLRAAGARYQVLDDDALASMRPWMRSSLRMRSVGSRAAWSSDRARSARVPSWPTRERPTCRSGSTSRSSTASRSGPFAPAVCYEDADRWFDLREPSPYMLLVADVVEQHRIAMSRGTGGVIRYRQAQCAALDDSGSDACRLFGAPADRASGNQSTLPPVAIEVPRSHRMPRAGEHELQCARRADRLHAG